MLLVPNILQETFVLIFHHNHYLRLYNAGVTMLIYSED